MEFFFMWARSSTSNRVDIDSRSRLIQASASQSSELGSLSIFLFVVALGAFEGGGELGGVAMGPVKKQK